MTKEELVARLQDIEWDDFEVKAAKGGLPKRLREEGKNVAKNVAKNVTERQTLIFKTE